ncbi:MAG: FtsX-like permease family protein [Eubacterium sp.]|nr:FtsX-like permease family protein [Eubacterium sp.]
MKITQLKDSVRNVKKKRVSWISIVIVIMMSVGCYLGCNFYKQSMSDMGEAYYKEQNFKDLEVVSTTGVSQTEIDKIKEVEGVEAVEPFNLLKVSLLYKDKKTPIDFVSWTERVSIPTIVAGEKPEKQDEVAISDILSRNTGIKIGDYIEVVADESASQYLKTKKFKVTALVNHPDYMRTKFCDFVVAPDAAFDMEKTNGYYLRAIIDVEYPDDTYLFSNEYYEAVKPTEKRLEKIMDGLGTDHDTEIKNKAQSELDDKKAEADKEIADAEKKIKDGQKEYDDKIADAEKKLQEARDKINGYDKEIGEKEKLLTTGIDTYEKSKAQATSMIEAGKSQISDAQTLLKQAKEQLDSAKAVLDTAEAELAVAKSKLATAKSEYETKKTEAEEKFASAKVKLDAAIDESNAAKAEVDNFEKLLNNIAASTGMVVPQQYYDLKDKAKDIYTPVVEAVINDQDTTDVRAKADSDMGVAVDEALYGGAAPLMPFIREMNVRDFFTFAQVFYGDVKVLDVLDKFDSLFVNGFPGSSIIRAFVEATDPDMNISGILSYLDSAAELMGLGDTRVGMMTEPGEALVKEQMTKVGMAMASQDVLKEAVETLNQKIAEADQLIAKYEAEIAEAEKKIADGESKISEGKKKFEEGKAEFEKNAKTVDELDVTLAEKTEEAEKKLKEAEDLISSGKEQLASAKSTLASYKSELEKKQEEYEEQKAEGKKKLDDARQKLDDKKKEANEKIDEAQEKIDTMPQTHFVLQSRRANEGFLDIFTVVNVIKASAACFIIVFILIGILVCFSTITIIIDEQKSLVGTQKSLGFFNSAIRSKYMLFGVSSVTTGIIAGFGLNFLLQFIFQKGIGLLYIVGIPETYFNVIPAVGISVIEILVAVIATYAACHTLLKLSAVELVSGQASLKRVRKRAAKSKNVKKGASIYSRLIRRNMLNDIVRVIISVVIISASCSMIGAGFTLKFAFSDMIDNQLTDVYKYDVSINYPTGNDFEDKIKKTEELIAESGAVYSKAGSSITIYHVGDLKEYSTVTILNSMAHPDYYSVIDYFTGEEMKIPEEGVLIQSRLYERTGLEVGDKITLYKPDLGKVDVEVKGVYNNYVGRDLIMSDSAYKKFSGEDFVNNVMFIKLKGADVNELEEQLRNVFPEATVNTPQSVRDSYKVLSMIYDMIVLILTGFAILMSIFILSNLTNIFVARRRKELIVMRVNGFSTKQCIGYLTKETVATTVISFIIAVLVGIFMAKLMISFIETDYTMYERSVSIKSWIFAIGMETIFAGIIDYLAFRKVKNLKVTDINE